MDNKELELRYPDSYPSESNIKEGRLTIKNPYMLSAKEWDFTDVL